jgi:hypothetical protein
MLVFPRTQDYPQQLISPTGSNERSTEAEALYGWGEKPIHGGDLGWLAEKAMSRKASLKEMCIRMELQSGSRRGICMGYSDTVDYRNSLTLPYSQYLRMGRRRRRRRRTVINSMAKFFSKV